MPPIEGEQCDNCGKQAHYGLEPACRACYWPHAKYAPNVRLAQKTKDALEERFGSTREKAERGSWQPLFEALVDLGDRAEAVTAVEPNFAFDLFANARKLYSPYASQVRGRIRAPASDLDDSRRRLVDTLIYGGYGEDMNFAALSPDGSGLSSWGPIFLKLDTDAIAYRSTVIEENSFHFVRSRGLSTETVEARPSLLAGYLSVWESRSKLVASKLGPRLAKLPDSPNIEESLLVASATRMDTDYLEVHIFGPYNYQAVQEIRALGGELNQPINKALFQAFEHLVGDLGMPLVVV